MIKIDDFLIGNGQECFIVFEAGPTHSGLESAKKLAGYAKNAGGQAIKFQILDSEKLILDKSQLFTYKILKNRNSGELEEISEPLYDILKRREMSFQEWEELKNYCDEIGILFFATVGFDEDIDFLEKIGCKSLKIASADINHEPLLIRAALSGMVIQLDTGMASLAEIENAVDLIESNGNSNIIIHHCPSGYPARADGINLNVISTLKQMFNYPIAFSDHSPGYDIDIAAVSLGVNMVEKTITLDSTTRSVEHVMSIEPHEMENFVKKIKEIEKSFGSKRRILFDIEKTNRDKVRRSVVLTKIGKKGMKLKECEFTYKRPGFGISPDKVKLFLNRKLVQDVEPNIMLKEEDFVEKE